jgi:hypothetical protein
MALSTKPPAWLAVTALSIAWALASPDARADGTAVDALIDRGLDLRQARRDADALALFEEAQAMAPSPRGQAQVALAQQALGRWVQAERNLVAALAAKADPWIESRRPILAQALTVIGTHLGDVQLIGVSAGDVFVDGLRMDEPDARTHLRLEVGRRTIEVRAPGMYPVSRALDIEAGQPMRVEVEQRPLLAVQPMVVQAGPQGEGPGSPAGPAPATEPWTAQRIAGWAVLGGAGLLAVTGTIAQVLHGTAVSDFNGNTTCTTTPSNQLQGQCADWRANGTTDQTVAIVAFVGAGAAAATAVTLLLTAKSGSGGGGVKRAWIEPRCAPLGGGGLCGVSGSF